MPKKTEIVRFRIDEETAREIEAIAVRRGETKAEAIRYLLRKAIALENAEEGADELLLTVRKAMGEVLKPVEERLAKINAKTAIAAATALFANLEVFGQFGKDARALHEAARKKAVAFVRTPTATDQVQGEDG